MDTSDKTKLHSHSRMPWMRVCFRRIQSLTLSILTIFILVSASIYSQHKSTKQPSALPKNYEIFINDFAVPLHLAPSKKSEVIRTIGYGANIKYDPEFLVDPNPHWLPIVDEKGMSGFVMRAQILEFPSNKRFAFISKDINQKILTLRKNPNLVNSYELVEYLFQVVTEGDFTGNEYLFLKTKGGEALALMIQTTPEKSIDPIFFRKYEKYLTRGSDKKIRMDENYFWKYSSLNSDTFYGDVSAQLAVEFTPVPHCKGEPGCFLDYINFSYLKYLGNFPSGKKSNQYTNDLIKLTSDFMKDKDDIRCFPPLPKYNWTSLERTKFRIQYLKPQAQKKMSMYIEKLEKECFPSYKG
jgi:hypothetical protein